MEIYEYRVIPYRVEAKPFAKDAERQAACGEHLYRMLAQHQADGFAFYRIERVHAMQFTAVPGTFDPHPVDLAIFRRRVG